MPSQTLKRSSKKTAVKKLTKKKSSTKSKKPVAHRSTAEIPLVGMVEHMQTDINRESDHPSENIIQKFEKRFVFVGSCSNCEHLPMSVGGLVALMFVLVATLSGIVLVQANPSALHALVANVRGVPSTTIAQN